MALTKKAAVFARAYVANGGNGTQAAITAGYARGSAHVTASRLLKDPLVAAEIEVIRSGRVPVTSLGNGGTPPPLNGQILDASHPGPHPRGKRRMDEEEELDRNFIVAGLKRVFSVAMGDEMVEVAMVVKGTKTVDGQGSIETLETVRVKVTSLNLPAANGALKQLSEQLDIIGKLGGTLKPSGQQFLAAQYADKLAEMRAHLPVEDTAAAA